MNDDRRAFRRSKPLGRKTVDNIEGYAFILLPVAIIAVFGIYPAANVFVMSFQKFNMLAGGTATFAGFSNYIGFFKDPSFWQTFRNTAFFAAVVVPVQTGIALLFAVLVNQAIKGVTFFRTVFFFPVVMSFVVVSIFWKMIYDPNYGLANSVLAFLHIPQQQFLVDPNQAMLAVIVVCIWKSWGWYMVLFLAGLQDIPKELYESSYLDGASAFRRFISITLPLLKRTTYFILIMTIIDSFKIFTPIYIMTGGGPLGNTDTLVHYIWNTAFRMNDMGSATAMSICLFVVVFALTIIQMKVEKEED